MNSTSDIQNKWQALYNAGLNLGVKTGAEQDAGNAGRYQQYANARIYWHPQAGTFEVHGGILSKYLTMGGAGVNPATNHRDLGFPISDESWLVGESKRVSYFEWGAIYWVNGGRCIHGDLFNTYKRLGENYSDLGLPVSDNINTSSWEIAYFECGCLFKAGNLPVIKFSFVPHLIGNPYFAGTSKGNSLENTLHIIGEVSSANANNPLLTYFKHNTTILSNLFSKKYCLKGVHSADIIHLDITVTKIDSTTTTLPRVLNPTDPFGHPHPPQYNLQMSANAVIPLDQQLKNRELYDLCFALDDNNLFVTSPHCVYAKDNWDSFAAIHITDSHVATRYDWVKRELKKHPELDQAYPLFMNPNDNFRDFVKYANQLYKAGEIDVVIHTGDLVDYIFENNTAQGALLNVDLESIVEIPVNILEDVYDAAKSVVNTIVNWFGGGSDKPKPTAADLAENANQSLRQMFEKNNAVFAGGGNFEWFINLLLGRTKYADDAQSPTEELLVPILTTLGNHDFRPFAYDPAVEVDFSVEGHKVVTLYPSYQNPDWNLTRAEAIFLQKLWRVDVDISPERALSYITHYYDLPQYYARKINRAGSFVKHLGSNRLVLMNTWYDAGIESLFKLAASDLGFEESEDVANVFKGGDTLGFEQTDINMLKAVLTDKSVTGAVIVGIHAPAINPDGGEYNHYFRETEHATIDPALMRGYIKRNVDKNINAADLNKLEGGSDVKGWIVSGTPKFKRGSLDDNLDNGAPFNNKQQFWDACAGKNADTRKANLVLSGHVHKHTEWRIEWVEAKQSMNCYCDFYFENPSDYYSSIYPNSEKVHVHIVPGSVVNEPVNGDNRNGISYKFTEIPPNQDTLNNSGNAQQWWETHSPVITQTACLGWMDYPQRQDPDVPSQFNFKPEPSFTGLRVITINNNVISNVKFVNHDQIKITTKRGIEITDSRDIL